jgi:hypothetical protein
MDDGYGTQEDGTLAIPDGQTIRFNGPQVDGSFDVTLKDGQLLVEFNGVTQLAVLPLSVNRFVFESHWKVVR